MCTKLTFELIQNSIKKDSELLFDVEAQEIDVTLEDIKVIQFYDAIVDSKFDKSYVSSREEYTKSEIKNIARDGKIYYVKSEFLSELAEKLSDLLISNLGLYPLMNESCIVKSERNVLGLISVEELEADYDRSRRNFMELSRQIVTAEEFRVLNLYLRNLFINIGIFTFHDLKRVIGVNNAIKRALNITEDEVNKMFPKFKRCTGILFEYAQSMARTRLLNNICVADFSE